MLSFISSSNLANISIVVVVACTLHTDAFRVVPPKHALVKIKCSLESCSFGSPTVRSGIASTKLHGNPGDKDDKSCALFDFSAASSVATLGLCCLGLVVAPLSVLAPLPSDAATMADAASSSRKALVVETTLPELRRSTASPKTVDTKALLRVVFANRNALSASLRRIAATADEELRTRPWTDVGRELAAVESDVAVPRLTKVSPPSDLQGAIQDLLRGKLGVVVDGEFVSVDVEQVVQQGQGGTTNPGDAEITIHVRGSRLRAPDSAVGRDTAPVATVVQQNALQTFWNEPLSVSFYPDATVSQGNAILGATAVAVAGAYVASYQFYLSEIAKAEAASAAKKAKAAAAKQPKKVKPKPNNMEPAAEKPDKVDPAEQPKPPSKAEPAAAKTDKVEPAAAKTEKKTKEAGPVISSQTTTMATKTETEEETNKQVDPPLLQELNKQSTKVKTENTNGGDDDGAKDVPAPEISSSPIATTYDVETTIDNTAVAEAGTEENTTNIDTTKPRKRDFFKRLFSSKKK